MLVFLFRRIFENYLYSTCKYCVPPRTCMYLKIKKQAFSFFVLIALSSPEGRLAHHSGGAGAGARARALRHTRVDGGSRIPPALHSSRGPHLIAPRIGKNTGGRPRQKSTTSVSCTVHRSQRSVSWRAEGLKGKGLRLYSSSFRVLYTSLGFTVVVVVVRAIGRFRVVRHPRCSRL